MGVVVGVLGSSTQNGLLVGVGVFVSGKTESSKHTGVFLLKLVVHSSILLLEKWIKQYKLDHVIPVGEELRINRWYTPLGEVNQAM